MNEATDSDKAAVMEKVVPVVAQTPLLLVVFSLWAQASEEWEETLTRGTKKTTRTTSEKHSSLKIKLTKMKKAGLSMT